jgi:hypothetical protein
MDPDKKRCRGCRKEEYPWDMAEGYCMSCLEKLEEKTRKEVEKLEEESRRLEERAQEGPSEAVKNLQAFAGEYKRKLAEFRTFIAEQGFELTYDQLRAILAAMDEKGIKVNRESVLEFLEWRQKEGKD